MSCPPKPVAALGWAQARSPCACSCPSRGCWSPQHMPHGGAGQLLLRCSGPMLHTGCRFAGFRDRRGVGGGRVWGLLSLWVFPEFGDGDQCSGPRWGVWRETEPGARGRSPAQPSAAPRAFHRGGRVSWGGLAARPPAASVGSAGLCVIGDPEIHRLHGPLQAPRPCGPVCRGPLQAYLGAVLPEGGCGAGCVRE